MSRSGIEFEKLALAGIQRLRPYDPGHDLVALRKRFGAQGLLELGSNENTYGPAPGVREAILAALDGIHRYPDPLGGELKRALAAVHGVATSQILLGNGSHELLMQFAQVFAGPGADVVASQYGFAVYALAAQAAGANFVAAPAFPREHAMARGHDIDAIAAAITPATRLVYLANPNNPTGTWIEAGKLRAFLSRVPADVLVVVDEAYADFVDVPDYASALSWLADHPNLIVTRTFSKAHALAGLRVGYAVADSRFVGVMERVRESFNVNALGLAAAQAALADDQRLPAMRIRNAAERSALGDALRARGWFVHPSQTNFLLVEFGKGSVALEQALVARGVVARPMAGYGLPDCLRITVGDAHENGRLLRAIDELEPLGASTRGGP